MQKVNTYDCTHISCFKIKEKGSSHYQYIENIQIEKLFNFSLCGKQYPMLKSIKVKSKIVIHIRCKSAISSLVNQCQ